VTRTVTTCDHCSREIPAGAPRWVLASRQRDPALTADACSSACVTAIATAVERQGAAPVEPAR
jgi:hypothetical protein